jgi:glycosyltransferase involved in cell wall biosynthesis
MRVAFVISHPIQYYVPLLRGLFEKDNLEIKVFYTWGEDSVKKFDPSYNKIIEWDIPLLNGYEHEFLENISTDPGTHHFKGIDNPIIIDRIKDFGPDKIVVFGWSFKSHLKVLRYFKGKIPIYFRGDSHLLNSSFGFKSIIRRIFLTWVYQHIDFAISVGTNNKKYYEWVGLSKNKILFAPHAIDNRRFQQTSVNEKPIFSRKGLGIPTDNIVFIYCGSFEARKNIKLLIQAKLNLQLESCSLILVGNGKEELELKSMSEKDSQIIFIDFVNQSKLPEVYKLADVFVLFSNIETWGLVVNEAMASGLAIITSEKVGCAIDLVKDNGFIVKANDIEGLVSKMEEFVKNKSQLELSKIRSKQIIEDWSMSELINKFELILKVPIS